MKVLDFLRDFTRVGLGPEAARTAEVRFLVKGVEMRVGTVRVEVGDPVTWTVDLDNDPATEGHVLTAAEAEAAFAERTIERDA